MGTESLGSSSTATEHGREHMSQSKSDPKCSLIDDFSEKTLEKDEKLKENLVEIEKIMEEDERNFSEEEKIRADVLAMGFAKNETHILEEDPNMDLEEWFNPIKQNEKMEGIGTVLSNSSTPNEKRKRDLNSERAEEDRVQEDEKESFDKFDLPEFKASPKKVNRKGRKYGSMLALQEGSLTEVERRRRDRACRRQKKKDKGETLSELEGRSISDSDIQARKEILLLEAKEHLN
ncbi:hypothetical protein V6N11_061044 [Hibiscus sabdariffa]|uniref:Uncharacterized protein n=1 Tax=Hibiscus sabdariffa TaxID=183260 RepID=A0ABR2QS69_9ROSI